jgi:molecular chaperone GrpE
VKVKAMTEDPQSSGADSVRPDFKPQRSGQQVDATSASGQDPIDFGVDSAFESTGGGEANVEWLTRAAKLEGELREANERAIRAQAELDNFRKRSRREAEEERRYAALPLIRDLLSVMDNLDRALEAAEKTQQGSSLVEGVKMVAIQFTTYLDQHGCRKIPAIGLPFNPHHHEAIAQEPSNEVAAGNVTRIARNGYQLHDRVVRPAQVLVSTGPAS